MLKSNQKNNIIINALIELGEDVTAEAKGKGRKFVSKFIEPGVAHYEEFGDVLITKETLDKFIQTIIGCPVIITHKDITDKNADKVSFRRRKSTSRAGESPESGREFHNT